MNLHYSRPQRIMICKLFRNSLLVKPVAFMRGVVPLLVLALVETLLRRKLLASASVDNGYRAVAVAENKLARVAWKQLNGQYPATEIVNLLLSL